MSSQTSRIITLWILNCLLLRAFLVNFPVALEWVLDKLNLESKGHEKNLWRDEEIQYFKRTLRIQYMCGHKDG